jgi:hypothetical protein
MSEETFDGSFKERRINDFACPKVRGIITEQDDSQWAGKTPLTDVLVEACGAVLGIVGPAGRDQWLRHWH